MGILIKKSTDDIKFTAYRKLLLRAVDLAVKLRSEFQKSLQYYGTGFVS